MAENTKYRESSTMNLGGNIRVFYDNYGLSAKYHGLEGTEYLKPDFVFSTVATEIFEDAPMTGNAEDDYNELKSKDFNVTTNGGSAEVLCGKYGIHLHAN